MANAFAVGLLILPASLTVGVKTPVSMTGLFVVLLCFFAEGVALRL